MKKITNDTVAFFAGLRSAIDQRIVDTTKSVLTPRARQSVENEVEELISRLGKFLTDLDPVRQPTSMFDPSNPKVIGRFTSLALVAQQRLPLKAIAPFYGSGIYAIYYNGPLKLYQPISRTETPIYVGQAAPNSASARTPAEQGERLCNRLTEHQKNICKATTSLKIEDFEFRCLVVQSGWETAAEDYLIHLFHPIWNSETDIVYGLGKHGDSAITRANKRSPWDTIHPGRAWAAKTTAGDAKPLKQIEAELKIHFKEHPAFEKIEKVMAGFLEELRQI